MPDTVLLTGATGLLGSELLCELVSSTEAHVVCLIRGDGDAHARRRLRDVMVRMLGTDGWSLLRDRVSAVCGDITEPRLGMSAQAYAGLASRTTHVIHGAASVRFGLPYPQARRINVRGTEAMLDLAAQAMRRGRFRRFGYISTAFVGGRRPGIFYENDLVRGQTFRNTYERSKYEAELTVHARRSRLPVTVVRPSIVVGSSQTGVTRGFNVVYWPLRMYADGVIRYAPTDGSMPVDLVPVDYVARATVEAVLGSGREDETYCLAAGRDAVPAQEIADLAADVFDAAPPVLVRTPFDRWVLPVAARLIGLIPRLPRTQAYAEYLPYFLYPSRFDTTHAQALLGPRGIDAPPASSFLRPMLDYARATDFGRDRAAIRRAEQRAARQRLAAVRRARPRARRAAGRAAPAVPAGTALG